MIIKTTDITTQRNYEKGYVGDHHLLWASENQQPGARSSRLPLLSALDQQGENRAWDARYNQSGKPPVVLISIIASIKMFTVI